MLMVVVCKLLKVTVLFMVSTQLLKQLQQYMAQGKELGTNFMQQHAYSLGLRSDPEKGLHSFPGSPIPSKRSLVDSEELQSYTPLPIWGNSNFPGRGP